MKTQDYYLTDVLKPLPQDAGDLYQLVLSPVGYSNVDGWGKAELSVKNENRHGAWELFVLF